MENLPTRLCLRNKNLHCFRAYLRTPTRTVKYQVVILRGFIRSSLEYIMLVIQKRTMLRSSWSYDDWKNPPQNKLCWPEIGWISWIQTGFWLTFMKYNTMIWTECCPGCPYLASTRGWSVGIATDGQFWTEASRCSDPIQVEHVKNTTHWSPLISPPKKKTPRHSTLTNDGLEDENFQNGNHLYRP